MSTVTREQTTLPNSHPQEHHLIRAAGIMGLLTAVSRILGFIRDGLIAAFYGTSLTAQAFIVAFRIPNLLRDLVGEGAANTVFVPVFARTRTLEGEESWKLLVQAVWMRVFVGFIGLSLLGIVAAPWLVHLVAPGFRGDPELLRLTTTLTRILFPFIGLVGLSAFFMGLLNSVNHFTLPSLGPVLLNLAMIAGLFAWRQDALGLSCGVLIGGLLQLVVVWPMLRRIGVHLRFQFHQHPGVKQISRLMVPRMVGTGVYQISVLVDTIFASFRQLVGSGGIAALYFAQRFLHLPLALFGISMAQAVLPTMANHAAAKDMPAIKRTALMALRSSLLIAVPSSIGLIALGFPIVQTLLQRGAFSLESTRMTVVTLQWYAAGLASMCATKVLANTFYALHDTWTPVRSAATALVANVILNSILVLPMHLAGLALATSLSSTWNSLHLYQMLSRRLGSFGFEFRGWVLRVVAASVGMAAVSWFVWHMGSGFFIFHHSWVAAVLLVGAILSGVISFFLFGWLLGIQEVQQLSLWFLRKSRVLRRD